MALSLHRARFYNCTCDGSLLPFVVRTHLGRLPLFVIVWFTGSNFYGFVGEKNLYVG